MIEIELSDGRKAFIKEGKGKDLFWAYQNANNPNEILKLLMVRLIEIDGKKVTEDDLEELPLQDALTLTAKFSELMSPLSQKKQSSQ